MDIDDLVGPVARGALLLPRLGWFSLVFLFEGPGRWIGWSVCRRLSAGQFPRESFYVHDQAPLVIQLSVRLVGRLTCARSSSSWPNTCWACPSWTYSTFDISGVAT